MDLTPGANHLPCLIFTAGEHLCALPLEHVVETMRPQPVRPVQGAPSFVTGLATIRGASVPVVDASAVVGARGRSVPGRFVAVRTGERLAALAVSEVVGVRRIDPATFEKLPSLAGDSAAATIDAIARLDAEFLVVLRATQLVPRDIAAVAAPGDGR